MVQAARQILVPQGEAFAPGELGNVLFSGFGELVAFPDTFQPSRKNHRISQVGVAGRIRAAHLNAPGRSFTQTVGGNTHQRRTVGHSPRGGAGRLVAEHDALVGIHPLVGDRRELGGMPQNTGDELPRRGGQAELIIGIVEGVAIALEQGNMGVHGAACVTCKGFGHECGPHPVFQRHLFDQVAEGHDVIGHGQGIGKAQVYFLLAGGGFVVAELNGNAHVF